MMHMNEQIDRVRKLIAKREKALGFDWRTSYVSVRPADDGSAVVELSREELFKDITNGADPDAAGSRWGGEASLTFEDGLRAEIRILGKDPGIILWVISSVADIRRDPAHSAELISQAIMGETAVRLKREGDWFLARLRDGCHGWVRSWHVSEVPITDCENYDSRVTARVGLNVAYIHSEPDVNSLPVSDVVSGTRLIAGEADGGFRPVMLPGGRRGFIQTEHLTVPAAGSPDRGRLAERAMRFIGIPYLWGGTTAKAFDCSGFVKRVFLLEGVELPRDSDLQARMGEHIDPEDMGSVRVGDLLFFGEGNTISHVAIALSAGRFIHAYGEVKINSLRQEDTLYDEKLARSLLYARRVLPGEL